MRNQTKQGIMGNSMGNQDLDPVYNDDLPA